MESKQNIAILLTCHNRKDKTISCLDALFKATLPKGFALEVFLVDDGSTDGTSQVIKVKFPSVTIIQGDGNLYWNRGMHLAWETAIQYRKHDYFLWLNDDTILFKNALKEMIYDAIKSNAIIVGTTISSSEDKLTYGGRILKKGLVEPNGALQHCDYFNGNIVLIPQYVQAKIGINDTLFHHSLGDFDYGIRAKNNNINIYVAPKTCGICELNEGFKSWLRKDIPLKQRIKLLYSPTGNNPIEFFKFDNRHNGLLSACFHFITIHFRLLFLVK
jgi:GT2 family glycosyltransferase